MDTTLNRHRTMLDPGSSDFRIGKSGRSDRARVRQPIYESSCGDWEISGLPRQCFLFFSRVPRSSGYVEQWTGKKWGVCPVEKGYLPYLPISDVQYLRGRAWNPMPLLLGLFIFGHLKFLKKWSFSQNFIDLPDGKKKHGFSNARILFLRARFMKWYFSVPGFSRRENHRSFSANRWCEIASWLLHHRLPW